MRTTKIYDGNKEVYNGSYYVNTAIFKGRLHKDPQQVGQKAVKFALKLSNGKDEKTGEWREPTFADCTAFGDVSKRILKEYKPKDESWIIAKYYSKQHEGKYYKGFIVREIIMEQEFEKAGEALLDDDLPF